MDGILRRRRRRPGEGKQKVFGTHEAKHVSSKTAKESRIPSRAGRVQWSAAASQRALHNSSFPEVERMNEATEAGGWAASRGRGWDLGDRCQNTVKRRAVNLHAGSLRSRARD